MPDLFFNLSQTLSQTASQPDVFDRWGFAGVGVLLVGYLVWQHRAVMERVGPLLERTALVLERVARMLEDMESKQR